MGVQRNEIITTILEYSNIDELSSNDQKLAIHAKGAAQKAWAPYSKFRVGAALLLENGQIIEGNNQENSAYPSGLCAERVALFYANAQYPNVAVVALAIAAYSPNGLVSTPIPPCGACRQVLLETTQRFNTPIRLILCSSKKINIICDAKQLLPLQFNGDILP